MFSDVFCSWVDLIERGGGVEVVIGERFADFDEGLFDEMEVAEQSFVIEGLAGDDGGGREVVAVDWFLGAEEDDGVGGTELVGDLDCVHAQDSVD